MKQHIIILLLIAAPVFGNAQDNTAKYQAIISARVDTLVQKYIRGNSLTEPGTTTQSIKVIQEFKALFVPKATVFDDINAEFKPDKEDFPYVLRTKTLLEYFDEIVSQFPNGLTVTLKSAAPNYANLETGEVDLVLARNIQGVRSDGLYDFANDDTLLLKLAVQPDNAVKIQSISLVSMSLKIRNDEDLDGVVNALDGCLNQKGPVEFKGCPDDDGDGIPNPLDECPDKKGTSENKGCPGNRFAYNFVMCFSLGYMMNQHSLTAPTSDFGYSLLDLSQPGTGSKIENPGFDPGLALNAHLAYYFGSKKTKKNKGVSLGVNYGNFSSDYTVGGSKYFFLATDGGNNEYWRIVTLRAGSNEEVSSTVLNISLLFRLKAKFGKRLAVELGFGPSYISYSAQSTFKGTIDYEGIYQYDNVNGTLLTNGLSHYTYDTHDWLLMHDPNKPDSFDSSTDSLFNLLSDANSGYDFMLNSAPSNSGIKTKTAGRTGFGLNAVVDFYYHIKPRIAIKAGLGFVYSSLSNTKSDSYIAANETKGKYNSVFNSSAKSSYMALGGNIGVMIGFGLGKK